MMLPLYPKCRNGMNETLRLCVVCSKALPIRKFGPSTLVCSGCMPAGRSPYGFAVLDAGHIYTLSAIDGSCEQTVQFVKRCDLNNPERFPGNKNSYSGATLQMVMRVLLDRLNYLQNQIWCLENWVIIRLLRHAIWFLEFRAARRHGHSYWHGPVFASSAPLCKTCGHTICGHIHWPRGSESTR